MTSQTSQQISIVSERNLGFSANFSPPPV